MNMQTNAARAMHRRPHHHYTNHSSDAVPNLGDPNPSNDKRRRYFDKLKTHVQEKSPSAWITIEQDDAGNDVEVLQSMVNIFPDDDGNEGVYPDAITVVDVQEDINRSELQTKKLMIQYAEESKTYNKQIEYITRERELLSAAC